VTSAPCRRIGIFGAPLTRPLDFVDAYLGGEWMASRQDAEEHGPFRVTVTEVPHERGDVELIVTIPPRSGVREAFEGVLRTCDAAILLVAAGGWADQQEALEAFESALAGIAPRRPLFVVVNDFLPPRLAPEAACEAAAQGLAGAGPLLRGRICWWRHEKTGTPIARAAVDAAMS